MTTHTRKGVLDAIRRKARALNLLPVVFDFAGPTSRGLTETVSTLAHLARFVISEALVASFSAARAPVFNPDFFVPVLPIIRAGEQPYAMFEDLPAKEYFWVLPPMEYANAADAAARAFPLLLDAARAHNATKVRSVPT